MMVSVRDGVGCGGGGDARVLGLGFYTVTEEDNAYAWTYMIHHHH